MLIFLYSYRLILLKLLSIQSEFWNYSQSSKGFEQFWRKLTDD